MVRFARETILSVVIIGLPLYILGLNPDINKIALATAFYLALFSVLVVISLRLLDVSFMLLEIMASAIVMSIFARHPLFAVLSGVTFFIVLSAVERMRTGTT